MACAGISSRRRRLRALTSCRSTASAAAPSHQPMHCPSVRSRSDLHSYMSHACCAQRTHEHFYDVRGDLQPQAQAARFDELQIYRIGGGPKPSADALPIGVLQSLTVL